MAWTSNRVMWDRNNPYAYRDENLRRLGFKSYRAYLASELWAAIRKRVIARDQCCVKCHWRKKLQVHHRAYDPATLRGDNIDRLSTVCGRCHTKAERPGTPRGRYERLTQASAHVIKQSKNPTPKQQNKRRQRASYDDFKPIWSR